MGFKARPGERLLLLAATTAYQTEDFVAEAQRMGVELVLGTDRCHQLAKLWPEGALALDFRKPERAVSQIVAGTADRPVRGIVATDEKTALIGAMAAAQLRLPHNPVDAARAASNKLLLRRRLGAAEVPQPAYRAIAASVDPRTFAGELDYPVVIKPLHLSASRGVMRADDPDQLVDCWRRVVRLVRRPEVAAKDTHGAGQLLVEQFVPGAEVAFEGLLSRGRLRTLALFDKPEDLDGPTFAETIYTTPSTLPAATQRAIVACVAEAAEAIELSEGPVHAELRLGPDGPCVLEVAARSIGGLCARVLRYGTGMSLEEIVIAHALGRPVAPRPFARASGILMLPVPAAGVLRGVRGVAAAERITGVREVTITARKGDTLEPLPEGSQYLGFVFATGAAAPAVRGALDRARAAIRFDVAAQL